MTLSAWFSLSSRTPARRRPGLHGADDRRERLVLDVDASQASLAMYGSSAMTQATSWPWNRTLSVASTAWVS